MIRNILSLFFLILPIHVLHAQDHYLEDYSISEYRGNVVLNWTFKKGNTCNGIDIMRSSDSLVFVEVGHIEGICGDTAKAISYTFEDENPPKNIPIYYRLELGSVGATSVLAIRLFDYGEEGYLAFPNPLTSESIIVFPNDQGQEHEFRLYDTRGNLVRKESSRTDYFKVRKQDLNTGLYLFSITSDDYSSISKLLIEN